MTHEEVQDRAIISEEEKAGDFDSLPVSKEEIKKLPRKVRFDILHHLMAKPAERVLV